MNLPQSAHLLLPLLLAALPACTSTPPANPAPAESLFDGRSLTGWTQRGGGAVYSVQDGCIVGETRPKQPNSFLCTTREFSDFTLTLEFMVDDNLNSGVQIRSQSRPEANLERVFGYQVEIDPAPRAWTGGLYDEARRGWLVNLENNPAARAAFRHDAWNSMRVQCCGDHIQTWINDVPCVDTHDSMTPRGFIALQVHDVGPRTDPLHVRWRHILISPCTP